MITATFPNGRTVNAIILDEPFQGVSGLVECANCEWRAVITSLGTDSISDDIERFAMTHHCDLKGGHDARVCSIA